MDNNLMYFTLAVLVFFGAIVVFFVQEFKNMFLKFLEIPGMLLLAPLAFASWAIYTFDYWVIWGVTYYHETLRLLLDALVYIIPFKAYATPIAAVIVLTAVSVIPVWVADYILLKRRYRGYQYAYITCALIWLISGAVLIVLDPVV